jgi:hypothetical protein
MMQDVVRETTGTSRIAMTKATFNNKKNLLLQIGLKFKEATICSVALYFGAKHLDASESRTEIPGKV